MKTRTMYLVLCGLLSIIFIISGCASPATPTTPAAVAPTQAPPTSAPVTQKQFVLGWSGPQVLDQFQIDVDKGFSDGAAALGMKLIHIENNNDPAKQASDIEDLLSQKIDALLIGAANADAIIPSIQKANALGIPVFTEDQGSNGGEVIAHFGNDNYCLGVRSMEYLASIIGDSGKVMHITGPAGTLIVNWNTDAAKLALKSFPNVTLVDQVYADWDPAKAQAFVEDNLTKNPDLNGIYVHSECMTSGVLQALKAQNLIGKVKIVQGGWSSDSQLWYDQQEVQGTVEYDAVTGAMNSAKVIYDYLANGTKPAAFFTSWPLKMHNEDGTTTMLQCPVGDWDPRTWTPQQ